MKLRVQYTAQLQAAAGRSEEELELPEGSSLAVLLDHLAVRLGDRAASHLTAPGGRLPRSLLVVVNGHAASAQEAAETVLRADDVVLLLPPIAGG